MSISYRQFRLADEEPTKLLRLFAATYGSARRLEARWDWQYANHPQSDRVLILVAVQDERIVAATSYLPMDILIAGRVLTCHHASDSMVHPEFRRRGLMSELYKRAIKEIGTNCAKGVNRGMDKLLEGLGYQYVEPDSTRVRYISPVRLVLNRLMGSGPRAMADVPRRGLHSQLKWVGRFDSRFDEFWNRVAPRYSAVVVKNSDYMNWRYVDIPHREYVALLREQDDQVVAVLVLSLHTDSASIADIIWDREVSKEPAFTVRAAITWARRAGFNKLSCWGTFSDLSDALQRTFFVDRGPPLRFLAYADGEQSRRAFQGDRAHFVDGDCDSEYV